MSDWRSVKVSLVISIRIFCDLLRWNKRSSLSGTQVPPHTSCYSIRRKHQTINIILSSASCPVSSLSLEKGQCLTFGSNQHGQLGCNSRRTGRLPYVVPQLQGITRVACGDAFTLAIGAGRTRSHNKHAKTSHMPRLVVFWMHQWLSFMKGTVVDQPK